ncbi:Proteasome component ECM29 [Erysiphe neolycopersici]|uniref:Proteasome component ECM29 n=1 Tax=Erysiphe neolycopersici TaxID=212602 RepID=A0A420HIN6_9PEZI|nr:Proteasome component ECM29 [Erysiphe neolycopersici]
MSTEARELDLCGKVEMRIALAEDDNLESTLKTYLAPLLLKLTSEHTTVRNKVISICQHIKIRLSGNQNIILPVASLLKQYKENLGSSMIRQFDLMFIQQGVGKLSPKEQRDLFPIILIGIANDHGNPTCAYMFNLFLRLLPQFKIPLRGSKEDLDLRGQLKFDKSPADAKFIAEWLGKLILLSINRSAETDATCPGLTRAEYEFLTLNGRKETWDVNCSTGLNLAEAKVIALNFLSSGAFLDSERFLPALFATGDSNSRISSIGDDLLKRSTVSLEDDALITKIFEMYFVVRPILQTRILILLTKSAISTSFTTKVISIVQEAIKPKQNTNIPNKGLETIKFRNALLNYVNWISRMATKEDSDRIAPHLFELLKSFIEDQGWPIPQEKSADILSLRALAYETLGSLAKSSPKMVLEEKLTIVRWLFRSLTEEKSSDEVIVSIEGALSSLLGVFVAPLNQALTFELRRHLLKYMTLEKNDTIVRDSCFTTVRWSNQCLEYDDVVGRWIDILAIGYSATQRNDVIEEGKKGLNPYLYKVLNSLPSSSDISLPSCEELINVLFTSESLLENSAEANSLKTGMAIDSVSVFGNFSGHRINAFAPAVTYCRQILLLTGLERSETPVKIDIDWEQKLDVLFHSDKNILNTMKAHIKSIDKDVFYIYLQAAFEGMLRNDGNGLSDCGKCFVEVLSISPQNIVGRFSDLAFKLMPAIESNNTDTRLLAARAYGILVSNPIREKDDVEKAIKKLLLEISSWESAFGAHANKIHGYILALGFILSRLSYYERSEILESQLVIDAILELVRMLLVVGSHSVKEAVLKAIGEVSIAGVLTTSLLEDSTIDLTQIIEILSTAAQKSDEKSISTLGRLSMIFDDDINESTNIKSHLSFILENLYKLYDLKQYEIQFMVGEAITCLAAGWESNVLILCRDVDTPWTGRLKRKHIIKSVIQKLLDDCKNTKPSLKKASAIWLFYLIQNCGHLEEVQTRLRHCQAAFMGLLSARDELVQETASRGLSLVYEQGDKILKESLVKDLVSSFTGSSTRLKVDDETELFEPGALPTGEGNSVISYKDIISLANEVGDQSLVYKFMSLASNAATWSTRAAFGRFGLSNILSESEIDPKLYPKLYRYRFDPNPNVRRSMNDIWKALVKDSTTIIDLYFHEIITDLLKIILGNEWRSRQASCAALASLVQGRDFEKYEKCLHEIWYVAFKLLDDIKGSVREAAQSLSVNLTNTLVRQIESGNHSKYANSMLKEVIPFLLSEQGLDSSAQDVRTFAMGTIIKIIKHGGKTLIPFIPDLIEKLLGLLSTLEPEQINYIYQRAVDHRDEIDQIRSSAVSQSPIMEAIERCLDILDEPSMQIIAPRLERLIKSLIGMPSKIGCAGVISSLATRHSFIFKKHADRYLKAVEKAVLDPNNTVSVAFAKASGYISRLVSDKALIGLASYIRSLYFEAESENRRLISGEIIHAVAKFASDRFNSMASKFLPFVFFASHDTDSEVKQLFEKTWLENVGGSRTIMLYLNEVIKLSIDCIESSKWTTKHTAALSIADTIESLGSCFSVPLAANIWPALDKALALKTFDGKEKVLNAFIKFVEQGSSFWKKDQIIARQIKKIIIREANRNNEQYRKHAFEALGGFSEAQSEFDIFDDVLKIINPFYEEFLNEEKMITSDEETESSREAHESAVLTAGISSLFRAVNFKISDPDPLTHLPQLIEIIPEVLHSRKVTATTRIVIYERINCLFDGLLKHSYQSNDVNKYDIAWQVISSLELGKDFGYESMRLKRANACNAIVRAFNGSVFGSSMEGRIDCANKMEQLIKVGMTNEMSSEVRAVLENTLKTLEQLKAVVAT